MPGNQVVVGIACAYLQRDQRRVVHDLHRLGMSGLAGAGLLIARVPGNNRDVSEVSLDIEVWWGVRVCSRREAAGVADRSGVDAAAGQPPDALLAAPEAAVREDKDLHVLRPRTLHRGAQNVVLRREPHLRGAAGQRVVLADQLAAATGAHE